MQSGYEKKQVVVLKNRTNKLQIGLGYNVAGDTFKSQIREEDDNESTLIAEWVITIVDEETGELELVLDDSVTAPITHSNGFMDLVRVTAGEPVAVWDEILEVLFRDTVTDPEV